MGQSTLKLCACGSRKAPHARQCMDCRFDKRRRKETAAYICTMVIPVRGLKPISVGAREL